MRDTRAVRILLALQSTRVLGLEFEEDGLVVDVAPTHKISRCGDCGCKVHGTHDQRERRWRHLDLGGIKVQLRYLIRRVRCPDCGVRVKAVPWAEAGSRFTFAAERYIAYLAQRTDRTTVTGLMRVAWRTVGDIIRRVVGRQRERDGDRLDGLRRIGIDELSYRRHHQYITVVVDHDRAEVVWAAERKNAETLSRFFEALGPERCAHASHSSSLTEATLTCRRSRTATRVSLSRYAR
jgi:transposase